MSSLQDTPLVSAVEASMKEHQIEESLITVITV